jgi:protein gp37
MAETSIEWTRGPNGEKGFTFNPWYGCTKVSPACDHCYAEGWAKRSGLVKWGPGADRRRSSDANWALPLKWNAEAEHLGVRYRVFCASLADVFDNAVPQEWRDDLWTLIAKTPHLDWLLLTKRIGNAGNMLPVPFDFERMYPNVWIGATICNQEEADRDIPKLLDVPAAKRFLSIEPLLGPVDLTRLSPKLFAAKANALTGMWKWENGPSKTETPALDWVIVGGESGPGARPMSPDWARALRDQCQAAGVPFMFKQWGEWVPMLGQAEGVSVRDKTTTPDGWVMGLAGKKATGRMLDGRELNEVPKC